MKKAFLFTSLFVFAVVTSQAQISKGSWLIGTSIGSSTLSFGNNDNNYSNSSTSYPNSERATTTRNFAINFGPQIGYFVKNNLMIGATLSAGFSSAHSNFTSTGASTLGTNLPSVESNSNTTSVSVGPLLRYYFGDINISKTLFFVQVNGSVGTSDGPTTASGEYDNYTYKTNGQTSGTFNWNAGGDLGVTHFINKSIGLIAYAGYSHGSSQGHSTSTTNYIYKNGTTPTSTDDHDFNNNTNGLSFSVGFNLFLSPHKSRG